MATIYAIYNKVTDKFYIGKTKSEPATKRWKSHLSTFRTLCRIRPNRHSNWTKLYLAMRKYGEENFEFVEILQCAEETMHGMEEYYIRQFDSVKRGYNILERDKLPTYHEMTQEQKQKHSNAITKAWSSEDSYFRTEEYVKKRSEGMKKAWSDPNSKLNSEESKEKRRKSLRGRKLTKEQCESISSVLMGNTYSRKMVEINGAVYDSCTIAADAVGVSLGTITTWLKNGKARKL